MIKMVHGHGAMQKAVNLGFFAVCNFPIPYWVLLKFDKQTKIK